MHNGRLLAAPWQSRCLTSKVTGAVSSTTFRRTCHEARNAFPSQTRAAAPASVAGIAQYAPCPQVTPYDQGSEGPLWFQRPRSERAAAAALYSGIGIESLPLGVRAMNCFRRSRWYADVGELMLAGEEIRSVRNLGIQSLFQTHAALHPLFARYAAIAPIVKHDGEDELFERAIRSVAELKDYDATPWVELPFDQRAILAKRLYDQPVAHLSLDRATKRALRATPNLQFVGALFSEGLRLKGRRTFDDTTLRLVHVSLIEMARDFVTTLGSRSRWLTALAALAARDDLHATTLKDVRWPASLIALCPDHTVGGLARLSPDDADRLWRLLAKDPMLCDELLATIELLAAVPTGLDADGLADHWQSEGLTVIPAGSVAGGHMPLGQAIAATMRHAAQSRLPEHYWSVLQHRFGLAGAPRMTLAGLGDAQGVTRERIRQMETRTLHVVGEWLDRPETRVAATRLHPRVTTCLRELNDLFADVARTPMRGDRFAQRACAILDDDSGSLDPIVALLARLRGIAEIAMGFKSLAPVWALDDKALRNGIRRRVGQLHEQLTQRTLEALTAQELADAINSAVPRDARITVPLVHAHADLCSTIEALPDGRYQGLSKALHRMLQVERALQRAGEPLHLDELHRHLNDLAVLSGRKPIKRPNLSNQISAAGRFLPIGRSGYWALSAWEGVETGTVFDLMERCLIEHDRPMSPDEIHAWIVQRRPVSINSVLAYLSMEDRFSRREGGRWGLARLMPLLDRPARLRLVRARAKGQVDRVRDIARRTLIDRPGQEMPLAELRDILTREHGIARQSVYAYVAIIEQLKTTPKPDRTGKIVRWVEPAAD